MEGVIEIAKPAARHLVFRIKTLGLAMATNKSAMTASSYEVEEMALRELGELAGAQTPDGTRYLGVDTIAGRQPHDKARGKPKTRQQKNSRRKAIGQPQADWQIGVCNKLKGAGPVEKKLGSVRKARIASLKVRGHRIRRLLKLNRKARKYTTKEYYLRSGSGWKSRGWMGRVSDWRGVRQQ